jgi:hypothetical protein
MKNLIEEKKKISEEYRNTFLKKYSEILDKNRKEISDNKKTGSFGIEVLEKLKAGFSGSEERLLNMDGAQRIQLAEIWSRDAKDLLDFYKDEPGYQSVLKDYDDMISYWKQQLNIVTEKMQKVEQSENTDDKDNEMKKLETERDKIFTKAS